jgi:hypothetical protein
MIRQGDRVAPMLEMHKTGRVLEIYNKQHKTMLVGGTLSAVRIAKVQLDKTGDIVEWFVRDLMQMDS